MRSHRLDPRRIKQHFAYTVEEAARALEVGKNTVRAWIKSGLPVADDRRPVVMSGAAIRSFLKGRKQARRRPLAAGQFYCFGCREPVPAFDGIADLVPCGPDLATLHALCPECGTLLHRRVSLARWRDAAAGLDVTVRPGAAPLKRD